SSWSLMFCTVDSNVSASSTPLRLMHDLLFSCSFLFFFFNDTAPTEIYTLSLHDALPISYADGMLRQLSFLHGHGEHGGYRFRRRSEEHTSELQSPYDLVCRLLLEKKKKTRRPYDFRRILYHARATSLRRFSALLVLYDLS